MNDGALWLRCSLEMLSTLELGRTPGYYHYGMETRHGDKKCPLCEIERRLRAFQTTWESLLKKIQEPQPDSKRDPLYVQFSNSQLVLSSKPLFRRLVQAYDRAGLEPYSGLDFDSALLSNWQTSDYKKLKSQIDQISECLNTAQHIWRLFVDGKTAKKKDNEWCELPGTPENGRPRQENLLQVSEYLSFLEQWISRKALIAQLGPYGDGGVLDHTFILAKYDTHYAIYQSWVGRYFVFQSHKSVLTGSTDLWSLDKSQFGYLVQSLLTEPEYRSLLFQLKPQEAMPGKFRLLEAPYDPVFALKNIQKTW